MMMELALFAPILQDLTGIDQIIWVALSFIRLRRFFHTIVRERIANRHRNRQHALSEMNALSDREFKMMFRLSRSAFDNLLEMLYSNYSDPDDMRAKASSGSNIILRTRLAVTLRWLAGGNYLDICFAFGIATGSFFHEDGVLWGTIALIDELFEIEFPFEDEAKLEQIADGFGTFSNGVLSHCVLAIDGWVVRTRQPTNKEVLFPVSYRNRKDCFGIIVLAGCDSETRFLMFSCKYTGATNDALAWKLCNMSTRLENGCLPSDYYFIGDEAFVNTNQFLVPWGGHAVVLFIYNRLKI
jgi:hypothetical protein